MQTPTADTITEDTAFSLTPAGLAALEGFAPGLENSVVENREMPEDGAHNRAQERRRQMTPSTQTALETPETAPAHENEAFQPEGTTEAAPFVPDTADKVDWVPSKIADARARAARIRENAELMAKEADRQADGLEWQFGPALQAFARQELTGKKKSIRLFHGVIGYRTKPAGVTVGNEGEAIVWAKANLPLAVTERLDKKALAEALLSTGEAVDFAAFTAAEEVFYIK